MKRTLRGTKLEEVQFQAEWTRNKLAEILDRVYVVEQLYYLSQSNLDAREVFEKATRQLGEDGKRITDEAKMWGFGPLSQPSEALVGLRLMA